ncbi:MAG TPA: porin [Blastocatellia bacterium]|nr:porin [Blastocatellia bacterium]
MGRAYNRASQCACCMALVCTMLFGATNALAQQAAGPGRDAIATKGKAANAASSEREPADEIKMEDMLLTIKRLEDRVKELEAKLSGSNGEVAASLKEVEALRADVTRMQEEKKEEDKKNSGFVSFFRRTEVTGSVDAYYSYNFNRPSGDLQLRNFDTKHNQFSFNLAEIALEKRVTPDDRLGFRMDLNFGPATEMVHSFEPGGGETFKHIQQGYLSYLAPAGKGLQLDVGKFVTPHGAEVIETRDNWNYSRSLLFSLAIPYYHFGVRATYPVSDRFSLAGFVVNGWNNVVDNNRRKTFGFQAVVKPNAKLTILHSYMAGPEQTDNDSDWRQLWDTTVSYTPNPTLSFMANYDYGLDRAAGERVHWQGMAVYARIQANPWLAFSPRFEWYDDHDGFTTGGRQTLKEVTITSEHKINDGLLTRLEYRRDFSDREFFLKPIDRLVRAQSTLAFGLVYSFSSKGEQ